MSGSVGSDVTPNGVLPDLSLSSIESTGGMLTAPATPIDSASAGSNTVSPRNPFGQPVPPSTAPKKTETSSSHAANLEHATQTSARSMTEPRKNTNTQHRSSPDHSSRNSLPPTSPSHSLHSNSISSNSNNLTPQQSPAGAPRHVEVPNTSALQIPRFGPLPTSEQQRRPHPNINTPPTNRVRQQMQSPPRDADLHMRPPIFDDDDDETTEPSSAANTAEREDFQEDNSTQTGVGVTGSVVKFFENTRKRLSTSRNPEDDGGSDDDGPILEGNGALQGSLICGSLQKLGRNGKWQMRWFETDGECLSYYKSNKRNKLLATLDLAKVRVVYVGAFAAAFFCLNVGLC